ncbi:MAG TPA: hypothetical protein VIK73_11910 [Limnochordales bacterium]
MMGLPAAEPSRYRQSLWWRPLELARRLASLDREAGLQAIGANSRLGDRLAAIEDPSNRLAPVVVEHLRAQDQAAEQRVRRWLGLTGRIDARA